MQQKLSPLTADATGKLYVLRHDRHTLRVNRTQVGIFEQTNKISLCCLLERKDCVALKPEVRLKILRNFSHKALERQLANKKLCGLLVLSDFSQRNGPRPVTMGLFNSPRGRSALTGSFGCQLLPRGLSSCRFARRLFRTSHLSHTIAAASAQPEAVGRDKA